MYTLPCCVYGDAGRSVQRGFYGLAAVAAAARNAVARYSGDEAEASDHGLVLGKQVAACLERRETDHKRCEHSADESKERTSSVRGVDRRALRLTKHKRLANTVDRYSHVIRVCVDSLYAKYLWRPT